MSKGTLTAILVFVALVVVGVLIVEYNSMATLDERVETAWTPLQAKLQTRYDSVPRLLNEVTLYVGQEIPQVKSIKEFQPHITDNTPISEKVKAANKIEDMLQSLIQYLTERYPNIISRYSVQQMANIMKNTDQTIGPETKAFNDAATSYNQSVRRFPMNIVAMILGFPTKYDYFAPQKG